MCLIKKKKLGSWNLENGSECPSPDPLTVETGQGESVGGPIEEGHGESGSESERHDREIDRRENTEETNGERGRKNRP